MALDTQQRSAITKKNRAARGEKELRLWCRQGTRNVIAELMDWVSDTEQASVMTNALIYVHSLGPEAAREALNPRHDLVVKDSWRERFDNESRREIARDPGDEVIAPRKYMGRMDHGLTKCGRVVMSRWDEPARADNIKDRERFIKDVAQGGWMHSVLERYESDAFPDWVGQSRCDDLNCRCQNY